MTEPGRRARLFLLLLSLPGCARTAAPLTASNTVAPPSLRGHVVMVLPGQGTGASLVGFDGELAYFLAEQAPGVKWVWPQALERAAMASASLRLEPGALPVDVFQAARVQRVGEPLFSALHSLGLLVDARYALLPFAVRYVGGEPGRVEVGAALVDTGDGDVLWQGVVAGQPAPPDQPLAVASAAAALARLLAR